MPFNLRDTIIYVIPPDESKMVVLKKTLGTTTLPTYYAKKFVDLRDWVQYSIDHTLITLDQNAIIVEYEERISALEAAVLALSSSTTERQTFATQSTDTMTITVNGGLLPSNENKIRVYRAGQFLDPLYWSVSGSDIILTFTPAGELFTVEFEYP